MTKSCNLEYNFKVALRKLTERAIRYPSLSILDEFENFSISIGPINGSDIIILK
jgi:hypothetical protein